VAALQPRAARRDGGARARAGAHDVDTHFRQAPFADNIPVLLGLTGVWNTTFLGYSSLAILPYTQALSKLAPHIQQARARARPAARARAAPGCALSPRTGVPGACRAHRPCSCNYSLARKACKHRAAALVVRTGRQRMHRHACATSSAGLFATRPGG